ncbi:hydrogenase maturation protease [Acidianus sulfidivorans JP7]|uniref:Hydrogenase maturation protease n=1 Tax=Acidianus sulfidivorans JP7 TaxID=619593 RepID=A0A2U9ILA2_9CREN|nr:hydrogenase maturation protease [Acidianus sulfidivorans]AWR96797.1 hydrogenase maturation protease [Acidianus sulfidivorans JP7]
MAIKIIGMGNRLYGDDAIGSVIAECMNAFDAEANGFQALTYIEKGDIVFFIDATMMDEEFNLFKIDIKKNEYTEISDPHRLSPLQVVALSKKSGNEPKEAYILAIKPQKLDWPGISDEAIERAKNLLEKYKDFLNKFGITINIEEIINCVNNKKNAPW